MHSTRRRFDFNGAAVFESQPFRVGRVHVGRIEGTPAPQRRQVMRDGVVDRVLATTHQEQLDGAVSRGVSSGKPRVGARNSRRRSQARRNLLQLVQHRRVAQLQSMRPVRVPGFCERLRIGIKVSVRMLLDQVERHATAAHELLHQLLGGRSVLPCRKAGRDRRAAVPCVARVRRRRASRQAPPILRAARSSAAGTVRKAPGSRSTVRTS